jgi:hypothetical protein
MNRSYLNGFGVPCLVALLGAVGCGEPSERPSEVNTLRVLAVRSDSPFAKPGSRASLSMLAFDGSPRAKLADGSPRETSTLWIGGCTNPPGDTYSGCLPFLQAIAEQFGEGPISAGTQPPTLPAGTVGWGENFEIQVPNDIISSRPHAPGVVYPYGIEMAFFAYCGGNLRRLNSGSKAFPFGCFDSETGEELGRDDFEYGFFPVFSYESLVNSNPVIASVEFDGKAVDDKTSCSDASPCALGYHCAKLGVCIPTIGRCTQSKKDDCDDHLLTVTVPRESVESAVVAHVAASEAPPETLWVSYYATAGSFEQDSRIINDPHSGFSDDTSGKWRANTATSQEVRLWLVVRDNRNGVVWAEQTVWVE